MSVKLKNDPRKYLTRSKLGGAGTVLSNSLPPKGDRIQAAERIAKGMLDNRWYIQLAPRKVRN